VQSYIDGGYSAEPTNESGDTTQDVDFEEVK
jgi:hypothetical protein